MMDVQAEWIRPARPTDGVCPVFKKTWSCPVPAKRATLILTALGVYEARINGERVSDYVLAPGWTAYAKRLQYQQYDITQQLCSDNTLTITVGRGWFSSPMPGWLESEDKARRAAGPIGIWGAICLDFGGGDARVIPTDSSWLWGESPVRFSEIYDGEVYNAGFVTPEWSTAEVFSWPKDILIPQEGELICEQERVAAKSVFRTPAGEIVVDFGQEVTGYVEFTVEAEEGEEVCFLHGEVLDRDGNFYNANYRSAKAQVRYFCREGRQTWHPLLTFFGFRYIKLERFPGEIRTEQFCAIAVYSAMRQTGTLRCGVPEINQLVSNILWGQRGNFLDVPTDCPQRDERLGWTGDAQVFIKAASYNYDVEKFFRKWLHDVAAEQRADGAVGQVVPDYLPDNAPSAAWGDAAIICPWQLYLSYGNTQILDEQFDSMRRWVEYIRSVTTTPFLWTGGRHFGDWLALDAPSGSHKGSTREDFIASAFYAHSCALLAKTGRILGRDMREYEELHSNIVLAFRQAFPSCHTQTEHVLAVQFGLAEDPQKTADALAELVIRDGGQNRTGFVGTPYILHVLSDYGHTELAYSLLLRKEYPSWLYSVEKGATTMWEHWDSILEDGGFWSNDMNSFNHYAYGSVIDWIYEKAAGIRVLEEYPGFSRVRIQPLPDKRLGWLEATVDTRHGRIHSSWSYIKDRIRLDVRTAVPALVVFGGHEDWIEPGTYTFWR